MNHSLTNPRRAIATIVCLALGFSLCNPLSLASAGESGSGGGGGGGGGGGRGGGRFGAQIGPALDPGTYLVKLSVDGKEMTTKVVIEADSLDR